MYCFHEVLFDAIHAARSKKSVKIVLQESVLGSIYMLFSPCPLLPSLLSVFFPLSS